MLVVGTVLVDAVLGVDAILVVGVVLVVALLVCAAVERTATAAEGENNISHIQVYAQTVNQDTL